MSHTCEYCDGTLTSTRLPCAKCGHALVGSVETKTTQAVHDYLFGLARTYPIKEYSSACPRCKAVNYLGRDFTRVIAYRVNL